MEQLTIAELAKLVNDELKNGNGNKRIVISDDNEGNGFHGLFYGFSSNSNNSFDESIYDSNYSGDDVIILG